jgi:hypothetical protein
VTADYSRSKSVRHRYKSIWMQRYATNLIVALLVTVSICACAEPARVGLMATSNIMPEVVGSNKTIQNAVAVTDVSGGKETNPMWTSQVNSPEFKSALEQSLRNSVLLTDSTGQAKYHVTARLVELKQPFAGIDMTVTSKVDYRVTAVPKGTEVLAEQITTPYTATFSSSFYGVERLRLANEGAIRENISAFIKKLIDALVNVERSNSTNLVSKPTS